MENNYISIRNLKKVYTSGSGIFSGGKHQLKAIDGVSLEIRKGKTLGLVGESGCGKSTIGRCLIRLTEPDSGEAIYQGIDIMKIKKSEFTPYRKKFQIIFQDPYSSLNPRMTVGDILKEIIKFHNPNKKKEIEDKCYKLLEVTGLNRNSINKYPHEFSGGQRQRIAIARALAVEPEFIVCDEPVSALDVSIQSQIINLLKDLQKEFGITYLFISHDLSVVKHISDDIAVMYLGKIMEFSEKEKLFSELYHPYTKSLLSSVPKPEPRNKSRAEALKGEIPSPLNIPSGCPFHTRCPQVIDICTELFPSKRGSDNHYAYCHLINDKTSGIK
ncbi:MAG: ATP-binding cassette domain-containing protein [Ignavibacteria bacterium]|nr:ATP-binding cassette domain-containing protein [Ignavibacteria bacterium]